MVFYMFLGLVAIVIVRQLARSRVMRAWLRGRSSDPSASAKLRSDESQRRNSWTDDGFV
jgi:predicted kinase